jgi:hypothetical protein
MKKVYFLTAKVILFFDLTKKNTNFAQKINALLRTQLSTVYQTI